MESWPCSYKYWNADLIFPNIGILALFFINFRIVILSFQTLEFWPYFYTHWFFRSYPSKQCNSRPICKSMGIIILSLQTLQFSSHPSKQWNSSPSFMNTEILILSFLMLDFFLYSCKHWNSDFIFPNIGGLALLRGMT